MARRYTSETIEAEQEQFTEFTEADIESLEFAPEDLEDIEAESTENINLEDVNPESVAELLESLMEGVEANGYRNGYGNGYTRPRSISSYVDKELRKRFTSIVREKVKKSNSNPKTRAKLQAAIRKGPTEVTRLLTPIVAKELQPPFRWLAGIYVPPVTRVLFGPIRKQAGVKAEEVEALPEWDFGANF